MKQFLITFLLFGFTGVFAQTAEQLQSGRAGKLETSADSDFVFEKIIFQTSECFGVCSEYYLVLDSSRSFKLHALVVYSKTDFGREVSREGYFEGKLNDTLFSDLMNALKTINVRELKMPSILCCDASLKTITIYFNGEKRSYKTMFPPAKADDLLAVLHRICENSNGNRVEMSFAHQP